MTTNKTGKPHPKVKFSPEEDFRLRAIIMRFGDHDWNLISSLMKDRNPRQCRERWLKYLAPNVRFEPWSPEEDHQLERLVHDFGQKWVKISRFFRNRTDINVKNRWLVLQRQKAKKTSQIETTQLSPPEPVLKPQLPVPILLKTTQIDLTPLEEPFALENPSEKSLPFFETNQLNLNIWDGIIPPTAIPFEPSVDPLHWN